MPDNFSAFSSPDDPAARRSAVYAIMAQIPPGKVISYGELAALAGLGVAIAPQQLVADDLRQRRLLAPWGFVETRARLALWVPARRVDRRAERLAEWLRNELERQ